MCRGSCQVTGLRLGTGRGLGQEMTRQVLSRTFVCRTGVRMMLMQTQLMRTCQPQWGSRPCSPDRNVLSHPPRGHSALVA